AIKQWPSPWTRNTARHFWIRNRTSTLENLNGYIAGLNNSRTLARETGTLGLITGTTSTGTVGMKTAVASSGRTSFRNSTGPWVVAQELGSWESSWPVRRLGSQHSLLDS